MGEHGADQKWAGNGNRADSTVASRLDCVFWTPACSLWRVGRRLHPERVAEYRAAVEALSAQADALKNLYGDAFNEANEKATAAELACEEARAALLADLRIESGDAEP
jgi:hypothetical protein